MSARFRRKTVGLAGVAWSMRVGARQFLADRYISRMNLDIIDDGMLADSESLDLSLLDSWEKTKNRASEFHELKVLHYTDSEYGVCSAAFKGLRYMSSKRIQGSFDLRSKTAN